MSDQQDIIIERTFKSALERALQYIHGASGEAALKKNTSWARKVLESVSIFEEELTSESGDLRKAPMRILGDKRLHGIYDPKNGKNQGFVWVETDGDYMLRHLNKGDEIPRGAYKAEAWSDLTHCAMTDEGAWRPKSGAIFDHLYYPVSVETPEGAEVTVQVRAWDLIQGEDINVLFNEGPMAYRRLKQRQQLMALKASSASAIADKKAAEADAVRQKADKEAEDAFLAAEEERKKAAKAALREVRSDAYKAQNVLWQELQAMYASTDPDTLLALSDEALDFLTSPPPFTKWLGEWWLDNAEEEDSPNVTLAKGMLAFLPTEVKQLLDMEKLAASLDRNVPLDG